MTQTIINLAIIIMITASTIGMAVSGKLQADLEKLIQYLGSHITLMGLAVLVLISLFISQLLF